jgi:cytidylate kinase
MHSFIVLCGPTCAGKTLGGSLLSKLLGYKHVEASAIMREICDRESGVLDIDQFAIKSLQEAPDRVPLQVLERFGASGVVLTGLRSPWEIETVRAHVANPLIAFVSAPAETRLLRGVSRARPGHPTTMKHLQCLDGLHAHMGLQSIESHPTTAAVENAGTITEYERLLADLAA